jgi:hypothetical protein
MLRHERAVTEEDSSVGRMNNGGSIEEDGSDGGSNADAQDDGLNDDDSYEGSNNDCPKTKEGGSNDDG